MGDCGISPAKQATQPGYPSPYSCNGNEF